MKRHKSTIRIRIQRACGKSGSIDSEGEDKILQAWVEGSHHPQIPSHRGLLQDPDVLIQKEKTRFYKPGLKVAITLRYLATGDSYKTLMYGFQQHIQLCQRCVRPSTRFTRMSS